MKVYIRKPENFNPKTLEFYKKNFKTVEERDAEVVVINDFEPIKTDKVVAVNVTCSDFVKAPKVIDLQGENLFDITAVAEWTLANMIILMRRESPGEQPKGKTLGIIGYGRIGWQVAHSALGFNIFPMAYDRQLRNLEIGVGFFAELHDLLKYSKIVSLHTTASEENRGFMNKDKFALMKDGSYFLNSARPWLVDMDALKWALDNKLAGAWFDFELPFTHPKLMTTSHKGGDTVEAKEFTEMLIAKKIKKIYAI